MMLRLVLMDFMDGNGRVNDRWLNGLFVDDGLDSLSDVNSCVSGYGEGTNLMYVMMNVLASNDWCYGVRFFRTSLSASILELQTLLLETSLDGLSISVLVFTVFDWDHVVNVLLWQHFTVFDWLHGSVVVILVHFAIDGGLSLLMTVRADLLIHNSRSDLLMDGGVMMTRLGPSIGCD